LLTESVLLSAIGGTLGVGLASVASDGLVQMISRGASLAIDLDLSQNARTLAFTVVTSLVAGIVFGLVPALRSWQEGMITAVRRQPTRRTPGAGVSR
jgi:ABC-type antimicrobial peptide transport system permease subunit